MTQPEEAPPPDLVAGNYRLTRLLGRGGMGSVWEGAHATLPGRRVAVKFIEADYVDSPEARSRFENEARAAARLHSKHVVQVYDHGVMPDGRPFIVMEYLQGEPLDRRLDRLGQLSLADTAIILQQVCRALAKAHQEGIVHRDLKPENIFLVWDDEDHTDIAKVVDFGIAKFTDASVGVSSATRTGSVLGTPYFMSPEQARGLRTVDHRSDLWSVGVIAYRCVVGRLPFEGEAVGDLLVKICTSPVPVPSQNAPGVSPAFDAWFARALSRDPAARFQDAADIGNQLCAAAGMPVRGEMPSTMTPLAQQLASMATAVAPVSHTPATGSQQGYHTPATGNYQAQQTPGYQLGPTAVSPAAMTGAPTTHTADTGARRAAPVGILVGAAVLMLLVVGVGIFALTKVLSGGGDVAASPSPEASAELAAAAASAEAAEIRAPISEPAPSVEAAPAEPSATPIEDKPAVPAPPPRPRRPVAVAPPRPAPVVPPRPAPAPRPAPTTRPRTVDIGY